MGVHRNETIYEIVRTTRNGAVKTVSAADTLPKARRLLKILQVHDDAPLTIWRKIITWKQITPDPIPIYRPPEHPPFDPNHLTMQTAKLGMRVIVNTNTRELKPGWIGTIILDDICSTKTQLAVLFDRCPDLDYADAYSRIYAVYPTSLTELKEEPK